MEIKSLINPTAENGSEGVRRVDAFGVRSSGVKGAKEHEKCEMRIAKKGGQTTFTRKQIRQCRSDEDSDPTVAVHSHIIDSR